MIGQLESQEVVARMDEQLHMRSLFVARQADDARFLMRRLLRAIGSLGDVVVGPDTAGALQAVRQACDDLDRALFGMTDFGKGGARPVLAKEKFELHTLLRTAVASQAFVAEALGVQLSCLVHRDVPRHACGEPSSVRQVLAAFVENAIRYTEGKQVLVRISPEEGSSSDSFALRFMVTDEGGGIARRMQSGKTGPGFEVFCDLVDLMGGDVGVDTDGEVWFTVVLRQAAGTEPDGTGPAKSTAAAPHHPILLVSNNPEGIPEVLIGLQRHGYTVELEQDRKRFPLRLREREYSMVLMDADGGSHVATVATWPLGDRLRKVPIVGVPRTGEKQARVDEEALLRIVERCVTGSRPQD